MSALLRSVFKHAAGGRRVPAAQRIILICLLVAACGAEIAPLEPAVWIPVDADVPVEFADRLPLPLCGISDDDIPPELVRCVLDAFEAGAGAELVLDTTRETGRAILVARVYPGRWVELIYGTHPQGFPWLWEVTRCDNIKGNPQDPSALVQGRCGPLTEIGQAADRTAAPSGPSRNSAVASSSTASGSTGNG